MKWFFQKENIGSDRTKLEDACKKQGVKFSEIEFYVSSEYAKMEGVNGICYGSINFIKRCSKYPIYPGPICNWKNFECTTYYSYLGKYLLNQNYCYITWGEFRRHFTNWFSKFDNNGCIFIRPNKGDKQFVGQIYDIRTSSFDKIAIEEPLPEDLIVIAEPRNILAEYRFVIVNKQVITGSRYKKNASLSTSGCYSADAANLADEIANTWQPDDIYCIDICQTSQGHHLLELNSFSCAGFYDCDHDLIVKYVTKYYDG